MQLLSAATPECCLCIKASKTQQIWHYKHSALQLFNIKLIIFCSICLLLLQSSSVDSCALFLGMNVWGRNMKQSASEKSVCSQLSHWKNTGTEKLFLRSSRCLHGCRRLLCHDDWPSFSSAATGLFINDIVEKSMYCWSYWKGWICLIKLS